MCFKPLDLHNMKQTTNFNVLISKMKDFKNKFFKKKFIFFGCGFIDVASLRVSKKNKKELVTTFWALGLATFVGIVLGLRSTRAAAFLRRMEEPTCGLHVCRVLCRGPPPFAVFILESSKEDGRPPCSTLS
jgi:ABC-type phosphate/phosphonate transport system permease subunit